MGPVGGASPDPPARRRPAGPVGTALVAIAVLVALSVGCCVLGVELATPGGSGFAQNVDSAVASWVAIHTVSGAAAARLLDTVGSPVEIVAFSLAAGVWLASRTGRRVLGSTPLLAAAVAAGVARLVEVVIARPSVGVDPTAGTAQGSSFPSWQLAAATATAGTVWLVASRTLGRRSATRWMALAPGALTALVAGAAVLSSTHWLSDVVVGVVVGAVVALMVSRLFVAGQRRPRPRWVTRAPRLLAIVAVVGAIPVVISYADALSYPGQAAASVRTVEWLRDRGLGGEVDRAEAWWLWHHEPPTHRSISALPPLPAPPAGQAPVAVPPAPTISTPIEVAPIISPALPGEGAWSAVQTAADGRLQIAATRVRPDPTHPELVATLAWMDTAAVRLTLVAGTREPGSAGPWGAKVPVDQQSALLAAFNSGFKMRDTPGGAIEEGRQYRPLADGLATLAIRPDGTATVGQWGRDIQPGPAVVAARQNLLLVVDGGQPVPGLDQNGDGRWGPQSQRAPAWRSGLGVDGAGHLIYASGNHLTLPLLADLLQRAGAVRAMELDIHSHMVTFNLFAHIFGDPRPIGRKLSPDMVVGASRYLTPDQRDFVAVFSR